MSYSSPFRDREIWAIVASLEENAYLSHGDGCGVVRLICSGCGANFEEELEAAKGKVVDREPFVCLGCDSIADEKALTSVSVLVGGE